MVRGDLTKDAEGVRLVAAFATFASQRQSSSDEVVGLLHPCGKQARLAEEHAD